MTHQMWKRPWTMMEGFIIGAGLIVAGLMLELSVGPVTWEAFAWPVNGIVLSFLLLALGMMYLLFKRVYAFSFLMSYQAGIPALIYAVALTIIMGLTRQTVNGQGLNNMLTFWPFVLIYVYLTVILGLVSLRQLSQLLRALFRSASKEGRKGWRFQPSLLFHLGLFISIVCGTLGSADMERVKMITVIGEPEWRVVDQQNHVKELPLAIELKRFIMEEYEDGSPKRFASDIQILTKSGKNFMATVDVNKPVEVDGWKIYQYGYDTQMGAMSRTSILELVRDPWLPYVYTGIYMMLFGAVCMFLMSSRMAGRNKSTDEQETNRENV